MRKLLIFLGLCSGSAFGQIGEVWYSEPAEFGAYDQQTCGDSEGNVICRLSDSSVIKISVEGLSSWRFRLPGVRLFDMTVGEDDNVYVCGGIEVSPNRFQGVIVRLSPEGALSSSWPDVGFGVGIRTTTGPEFEGDPFLVVREVGDSVVAFRRQQNRSVLMRWDSNGKPDTRWAADLVSPTGSRYQTYMSVHTGLMVSPDRQFIYHWNGSFRQTTKVSMSTGYPSPTWNSNGQPGCYFEPYTYSPYRWAMGADGTVAILRRREQHRFDVVAVGHDGIAKWTTNLNLVRWAGEQIVPMRDGGFLVLGKISRTGNLNGEVGLIARITKDGAPYPLWRSPSGYRSPEAPVLTARETADGSVWIVSEGPYARPIVTHVDKIGRMASAAVGKDSAFFASVSFSKNIHCDPSGGAILTYTDISDPITFEGGLAASRVGQWRTMAGLSIRTLEGEHLGGSLEHVAETDGYYYSAGSRLPISLELTTKLFGPTQEVARLKVSARLKSSFPGLVGRLSLKQAMSSGSFEEVGSFQVSSEGAMYEVIVDNHGQFVNRDSVTILRLDACFAEDADPAWDGWGVEVDLLRISALPF